MNAVTRLQALSYSLGVIGGKFNEKLAAEIGHIANIVENEKTRAVEAVKNTRDGWMTIPKVTQEEYDVAKGRKIAAIKMVRERTGAGIAEAKWAVELALGRGYA